MLVSLADIRANIEVFGRLGYIANDDSFYIIANNAYKKIAIDAKPYSLIRNLEQEEFFEPLIFLDECNFIATPPRIDAQSEHIELEVDLIDLFLWCYLHILNPESKEFSNKYKRELAEYRGRRHNERFEQPTQQARLSKLI